MANAYQLQVGNRTYTVVDDNYRHGFRVLIAGELQDELTQLPPATAFRVEADLDGLTPKQLSDGLFCMSGDPARVFPDLVNSPYTVNLTFTASRYQSSTLPVNVPQNSSFPIYIAAPVELEPRPVRIQGRVVTDSLRTPIAGARIIAVNDPGQLENLVAVRTPLHVDHANGTTVQERPLIPSGAAQQLQAPANAGDQIVTLNNRLGLAPNDILQIGSGHRTEFGQIESLAPVPANPAQPGEIALRIALNHTYPAATAVQKVTLGAAGSSRSLVRAARAGDGLLFLDLPLEVETLEITDPTPAHVEYHAIGALTDAHGFYALNGVDRVRSLKLKGSASGHPDKTVAWIVDYIEPVNLVDFRL